jgi:hypothetical protein
MREAQQQSEVMAQPLSRLQPGRSRGGGPELAEPMGREGWRLAKSSKSPQQLQRKRGRRRWWAPEILAELGACCT